MKSQFMLLGIFLILIGILIFVYWILLPVSEKEKILEEIYGQNKSNITREINYEQKQLDSLIIQNVYLYSGKKEIVISQNYTIGDLIGFYEIPLENIFIKTNIFSGVKSKTYLFSYQESEGAIISFVLKCNNGKVEIFVNDILFFEGCADGLREIYVQKEYLNKNNNYIKFKFYPTSIFSDSTFEIKNLRIIFVKRNELSFNYFYTGNENVFLEYNFCPTDPNAIELYINDNKVLLYSCYHNSFDITKYLNRGKNKIILKANIKTRINLKLITTLSIYTKIANLTKKNYVLHIIKNKGSGELYLNTCRFYLLPNREVFIFLVEANCINDGENIIIIKPDGFVELFSVILK